MYIILYIQHVVLRMVHQRTIRLVVDNYNWFGLYNMTAPLIHSTLNYRPTQSHNRNRQSSRVASMGKFHLGVGMDGFTMYFKSLALALTLTLVHCTLYV